MNSFRTMDWNSKWEWENLDMFSSKASESPKKIQATEWGIVVGEIDAGSFNVSGGGGGGSGGSGSDLGHGSSAKSSISASTDCSSKQGKTTSTFTFEAFGDVPKDFSKKNELVGAKLNKTSPSLEASVGSGEPLIGLKLGKRTYFENSCTGSIGKTSSFSTTPASSTSTKKIKLSCQAAHTPRCQVEGCNLDLSSAKEYHRKHRVCESHSKSSMVIVAGLERRFCQQCSRFHSLSEFDENKRSCRRRLSDHNARRRKQQQEPIQFNSTRLSSACYDGRQQMSFVLNNFPHSQTRPTGNSSWENTYSSKYTQSKGGYLLKSERASGIDGQHQLQGTQPPPAFCMPNHDSNRLSPCRGTPGTFFDQDFKEPIFSSNNIDAAAPDFGCALSLLSTNSWGSYEPEPPATTLQHNPMHVNHHTSSSMPHQHGMHHDVVVPLNDASSDYWQQAEHHHHHSTDARVHALAPANNSINGSSSHFQEFHLFKAPQEARFYSSPLN